jgi:hypothetical protein
VPRVDIKRLRDYFLAELFHLEDVPMQSKSAFLSLALSLLFFAACTSSSSVPLSDPAPPPTNPGEHGGEAKPSPTPSPTPDQGQNPGEPGKPGEPPKVVTEKFTRVYCSASFDDSTVAISGRVDGAPNYKMANINFVAENGQQASKIKAPVGLHSDGRDGKMILKAQFGDHNAPWKLYMADVDFLKQQGTLKPLSSSTTEPFPFHYANGNLNLPLKVAAANIGGNTFVYPDDKGTYVLQKSDGSKTVLPIGSGTYGNPKFSRDSWVAFDQVGSTISQRFYSIKSGKITAVASASSGSDYQLFGFVSSQGNFYWVEGRPGKDWKLRTSNGNKSTTLGTLPGVSKDINIPMEIYEDGGQVKVAYTEEKIEADPTGKMIVKKGILRILTVSSSGKLSDKNYEYPERIKAMVNPSNIPSAYRLLTGPFYDPLTKQVYMTATTQGLTSFDPANDSWDVHGTGDTCVYPTLSTEEIYE